MWTCDLSYDYVKINAEYPDVASRERTADDGCEDFGFVLDRYGRSAPARPAAPRRRAAVSASRETTSRCSTSTPPASPT